MSAKAEETRITNAEWQARKQAAMARGQGNIAPVYIERGLNAELWDVEGNRYIDFGTGIAVCNTGHSHTKVVAAMKRQGKEGEFRSNLHRGGTGFVAGRASSEDLLAALFRAERRMRDKRRRGAIQKRIMTIDWSWREPAREYVELYRSLCR